MNSFKCILTLIFLLLSSSVYAKEEIKAFFYTTNSVFMEHVKTTLSKMAKQRNYSISIFDGEADSKKQYDQLRNHISIGDLVVISVSEEEYLENMLKTAREHDARVVLFGASPSANIAKYYDKAWYVGFEIFDSARKQFSIISKYLTRFPRYDKNANGFLDVVFLQGRENEFSTHVRTQVILENFEKYGIKVNPLSYNYDDYSYSLAYEDFNVYGSFNKGWVFYLEPNRTGDTLFLQAIGTRSSSGPWIGGYNTSVTYYRATLHLTADGIAMFHATLLNPWDTSNRNHGYPIVPTTDVEGAAAE